MSTGIRYDLYNLLEQAGARPVGSGRFDCPDCGGERTVSADESKGVFCCHHAGCEFRGGIGTLKRRLRIQKEYLPRSEYLRRCQERERANHAAQVLYHRIQECRQRLLDPLHALNDLEQTAHSLGPENEAAWDAVSIVDAERPHIIAELTLLENSTAAELIRFLNANPETRLRTIDHVIEHGGLYDQDGKFVELEG